MPDLAAITVLTSTDGRSVNKVVRRAPDGALAKSMARHSGRFRARTVPAPDLEALAEVLRSVGACVDTCISTSAFVDPPAPEFVVLPMAELASKLGIDPNDRAALAGWHAVDGEWAAARMRENMCLGAWLLFDRDVYDDMPAELAELSFEEWRQAVELLFPGFASAGCVVVPSASTRVTVDGVPLTSASAHVYVRVDDPTQIPRAWSQATARALITEFRGMPLAFARPKRSRTTGKVVAVDWATVYDRSTHHPARLIFDGAPVVQGDGLGVASSSVIALAGPAFDLTGLADLAPRKEVGPISESLARITGTRQKVKLTHAPGRDGKPVTSGVYIPTSDLTLGLELETPAGWTTVGALYAASAGHTRCQSPFRESASWAAFYGVHADGLPFVFDTGTSEKHTLRVDDLAPMWRVILSWLVETLQPRFKANGHTIFSETLGRRATIRDVHPTPTVIDRLALASDAPRDSDGRAKRLALPAQFAAWLKVAWGQLLADLPIEDDAPTAVVTDDEFVRQLTALLTSMVVLTAPGAPHSTRSFGSWAWLAAQEAPGYWRRVQTYDLWGRVLDDAGFQLALTPRLASQAPRAWPELAELTLNRMTRRGREVGIAEVGDNRITCKGQTLRVVVLSAEYVLSLGLSYDLEDPWAAALRYALNPESGGTAGNPAGKPPKKGRSVQ